MLCSSVPRVTLRRLVVLTASFLTQNNFRRREVGQEKNRSWMLKEPLSHCKSKSAQVGLRWGILMVFWPQGAESEERLSAWPEVWPVSPNRKKWVFAK